MTDNWYSIGLEAEAPPLSDVQVDDLIEAGNGLEWFHGPAFSFGGDPSTVGVQVSIEADDPLAALERAVEGFARVTLEGGIDLGALDWIEIQTEERLERALSTPAPRYAGVTEVAELLGVSKQRVDQLRARDDFPKPVAELAAGPVWREDMLQRFIAEWPRRVGRPSKDQIVEEAAAARGGSVTHIRPMKGRSLTAVGRKAASSAGRTLKARAASKSKSSSKKR